MANNSAFNPAFRIRRLSVVNVDDYYEEATLQDRDGESFGSWFADEWTVDIRRAFGEDGELDERKADTIIRRYIRRTFGKSAVLV